MKLHVYAGNINIILKNSFQMVCDPNFRITSLCARWPGSISDSRIWKYSSLF